MRWLPSHTPPIVGFVLTRRLWLPESFILIQPNGIESINPARACC
ncbi:hypothetical protein KCO_09435 [Pectobacterium brasiliense ICMP 19477]|nr:hypothetical protein KCO_09435 [Pectobacterium brasiliense ICMP 19477]